MAVAIAAAAIRASADGHVLNLVDFANQLERKWVAGKAAQKRGRRAEAQLCHELIVIGELGYPRFAGPAPGCRSTRSASST